VLIDISPLRKHREFRLLFVSQLVSFLGSMVTYAAVPMHVYDLTRSSWAVGMMSLAQLVPVLAFGLLGGSFADRFDRRRLLVVCEALMGVGAMMLAMNAQRSSPSVALVFVVSASMQAVNAFHRPAMDALTQVLVDPEDYASIGALGSLRYTVGAIAGPALGGLLVAWRGAAAAFWVDAATFAGAVSMLVQLRPLPTTPSEEQSHLASIGAGLRYALSRPELVGTYVVDMVAMAFAFPLALFPEMAAAWGGASASGVLFSAMAVGSAVMTLLSGWTTRVRRRGAAVVIAAGLWGVAIVALGFAPGLWTAAFCLALAGAADMVSGLFRGVIWNETIPNTMRGRMAGIEMISYMSGPLIGNARAGWMAAHLSVRGSLVAGGVMCVVGIAATAFVLGAFWRYRSARSHASEHE